MMTHAIDRSAGFSLVEVMVAIVVMGIVTSQLLLSFSQQHTSSLEHERTIEIQEEARLVMDVILKDLRTGGFMVPKYAAVASNDGGVNASDALCISDASVVNENVLPTSSSRFTGARLKNGISGGASSVTVRTATIDIDSDGDVDFTRGQGIIIGTGTRAHCAVIDADPTIGASDTTISFTPSTVGGFVSSTDDSVIPALRYSVAAGTLSRNDIVLSSHIEDIQAEFGLDIDRNGTVEGAEFPIDDMDFQEYELVRNVRVHVTARETRTLLNFNGQFPAIANRVAGAADNFKRRRVTGDVMLRNLQ
jgi:prepilin-type N-terminal cleavage/methylation domain-containing protein